MTHRRILHIALPGIVSNVTVPLLTLFDTAISGHMGSPAVIGAVSVGGMLFNTMYWLFAFLRLSTGGHTAQALGRCDRQAIRHNMQRGLRKAFMYGILILLLSPLILHLSLPFITTDPHVSRLSSRYYYICIWGAPATLATFVINGWYVGLGNTRIPMYISIGQNVANILLSLYLVQVRHMGISGLACGTLASQWLACLVAYAVHHTAIPSFQASAPIPDTPSATPSAPATDISLFLRTLCMIIVHFMFVTAGARQGAATLAANTVMMTMFVIFSYFMDGFANAGESLAGQAAGRGDRHEYQATVHKLFQWGLAISTLFTVSYVILGPWFLTLLTDSRPVLRVIHTYRPWAVAIPYASMAAFIWDGIYVGTMRARYMLLSTASAMAVFLCGYHTLIPHIGNHGLWLSFIAYLAVRGLILTYCRNRYTIPHTPR